MSEERIAVIDGCLYNEKTGEVCMQARFVQKLVRCKDCKEWTKTAGDDEFGLGRCEFLEHELVMSRGFCAWGRRKDDA